MRKKVVEIINIDVKRIKRKHKSNLRLEKSPINLNFLLVKIAVRLDNAVRL